jgi:hypothetical protein
LRQGVVKRQRVGPLRTADQVPMTNKNLGLLDNVVVKLMASGFDWLLESDGLVSFSNWNG